MFLIEEDYITTSEDALRVLQQSKPEKRLTAEGMAIEEIAGYLRARYDTEKVFGAEGSKRNSFIVGIACDIALYHLVSWLPNKMGFEIRKIRYDRAVKWLEDVQKGKIMPGLPTYTGEGGEEDIHNPIRYGAGEKNNYVW